jgi:hypothetical protein
MSLLTDPASSILRRGLLWLAGLTTLGLAVELAAERHWTQPIQLVAWGALGAVSAAIVLLTRSPSRRGVQLARILAVAVLLSAVLGVGAHVYANYDSGGLDRRYSASWDSLSETTRWWLALSKTVGPAPPLAPGALAQVGLSLLLATLRHPALRRAQAPVAIDR